MNFVLNNILVGCVVFAGISIFARIPVLGWFGWIIALGAWIWLASRVTITGAEILSNSSNPRIPAMGWSALEGSDKLSKLKNILFKVVIILPIITFCLLIGNLYADAAIPVMNEYLTDLFTTSECTIANDNSGSPSYDWSEMESVYYLRLCKVAGVYKANQNNGFIGSIKFHSGTLRKPSGTRVTASVIVQTSPDGTNWGEYINVASSYSNVIGNDDHVFDNDNVTINFLSMGISPSNLKYVRVVGSLVYDRRDNNSVSHRLWYNSLGATVTYAYTVDSGQDLNELKTEVTKAKNESTNAKNNAADAKNMLNGTSNGGKSLAATYDRANSANSNTEYIRNTQLPSLDTKITNIQNMLASNDNTPPDIKKVSGTNGATCTTGSTYAVVISASDNGPASNLRYRVTCGSFDSGWVSNNSINITGLTGAGAKTATIMVSDNPSAPDSGNVAQTSYTFFKI